jgi:hypothetical protein
MWLMPTTVDPIPCLSRYLDAFRTDRQRAGTVVCVAGVIPMAAMMFERSA